MTRFFLFAYLLLALTTPSLATPRDGEIAVQWAEWVEICTADGKFKFSEAERLKVCLVLEQQLRDQGRCMYGPGVIGIWDGKHCR